MYYMYTMYILYINITGKILICNYCSPGLGRGNVYLYFQPNEYSNVVTLVIRSHHILNIVTCNSGIQTVRVEEISSTEYKIGNYV